MSLNTRPCTYREMSALELKRALKNQLHLKARMAGLLPDSGKKLDESISKLESLIVERENLASKGFISSKSHNSMNVSHISEPFRVPKSLNCLKKTISPGSKISTPVSTFASEPSICELIDGVTSLKLGSKNPILSESEENMDVIHKLSFDEVIHLRRFCNLPIPLEGVYHWYFFRLNKITPDLVCLTVLDCRNSNRHLTRCGVLSTWAIERPAGCGKTLTLSESDRRWALGEVPTFTAGDALCDLWDFITTSKGATEHPVLICSSHSVQHSDRNHKRTGDDIDRIRRLFCSTRHHTQARSKLPRDLLFVNATNALSAIFVSEVTQSDSVRPGVLANILETEIAFCLEARNELFVVNDDERLLRLKRFETSREFILKSYPRSAVWLEAPLNLIILRQIVFRPTDVPTSPPYVVTAASVKDTSEIKPCDKMPTDANVSLRVDDVMLRRLASVGFSSTSLTFLAGVAGWNGFSGLLASSRPACLSVCVFDSDGNCNESPLISSDLDFLQHLYRHFRRVYRGLALNASCFEENQSSTTKPVSHFGAGLTPNAISAPGSAAAVCASTGIHLAFPPRHIKALSLEESIEVMSRVRNEFKAIRTALNLPDLPPMPPKAVFSMRYRDAGALDSDDEEEALNDAD